MCWVIPPNSWATTSVLRIASSRSVLPWSTWPITVTTGGRGGGGSGPALHGASHGRSGRVDPRRAHSRFHLTVPRRPAGLLPRSRRAAGGELLGGGRPGLAAGLDPSAGGSKAGHGLFGHGGRGRPSLEPPGLEGFPDVLAGDPQP